MNSLIICHFTGKSYFINTNYLVLPAEDCYLTCNGHIVSENDQLEDGKIYHIVPRLVGGKGGFGSMLRAIGAQIEKTTNHEACRDISGRRLRDVNNEKKLKEWLGKKAEKDKERERQKEERKERRRALPNHKFEDETYHDQRKKVAENLEDALLQGLQKVKKAGPSCTLTSETATTSGVKRKAKPLEGGPTTKSKKKTEWLGIDIDDLSDLDSDEDSNSLSSQEDDSSPQQEENDEISQRSNRSPQGNDNSSSDHEESSSASNDSSQEKKTLNDETKSCNNITQKDNCNSNTNKTPNIGMGDHSEDSRQSKMESVKQVGLLESLSKVPPGGGDTENLNKDNDKDEPVDLDRYCSAEELQAVGLERLKAELMARKMKCGGNLEQRAERLFSVKGLSDDQIPQSLLAKPSKKK